LVGLQLQLLWFSWAVIHCPANMLEADGRCRVEEGEGLASTRLSKHRLSFVPKSVLFCPACTTSYTTTTTTITAITTDTV
jgi:hypothetical protein